MLQSTLGTLSSRLPDYPVDIPHEIQNNFRSYTEQILWNTVEMIYIKISFFKSLLRSVMEGDFYAIHFSFQG